MRHRRFMKWVGTSVFVVTALVACSSEPLEDDEEAGEQSLAATKKCGAYPTKPSCNAGAVVSYVWSHKFDTVSAAGACGGCAAAITAAGAVVAGSGGTAAPAVISAAGVLKVAGSAIACGDCLKFSKESGLASAIGCGLQKAIEGPCQYTKQAALQECKQSCGSVGPYGYLSGTLCKCTSDARVAACGKECPSWTKLSAPPDCGCYNK